jgi:SAM-dependent methyltransferase
MQLKRADHSQSPHLRLAHDSGSLIARETCPCCGSASLSLLYEEHYAGPGISAYMARHYEGRATPLKPGMVYRLCQCGNCGLAFQPFVPDKVLLQQIYDRWVDCAEMELGSELHINDYRYLDEQVQFMLQHLAKPPARIEALDFGFGWGHWARMAMAWGCRVSGVELSQERRERGRSIGIRLLELDALPPEAFDFINTEQVFEHLTNPREVLQRLSAALRPKGLLKISVPDATVALKKLKGTRSFSALDPQEQMAVAPLEHINAFTQRSLLTFGQSAGLRPVRPSLRRMYNAGSGWLELSRAVRLLTRPVYRHVLNRGTFMYFERP